MRIQYRKENFKAKQFEQELGLLANKISGYKHHGEKLDLFLNQLITPQEKVELDQAILNHVAEIEYELRIFEKLPKTMNPLISDFSLLGLVKEAPHYDRGRKVSARYLCPVHDQLVVEKIFKDIRDTQTNRLTALEVTFNWYNENNEIGLTKTEIVKNYNKAQAETESRKRRERSIDFLISEARDTENEIHIQTLIKHYEAEINSYKIENSDDFQQAILNETNQSILDILLMRVPFTSNHAFTIPVKESVLYQIGKLTGQEVLASLRPV